MSDRMDVDCLPRRVPAESFHPNDKRYFICFVIKWYLQTRCPGQWTSVRSIIDYVAKEARIITSGYEYRMLTRSIKGILDSMYSWRGGESEHTLLVEVHETDCELLVKREILNINNINHVDINIRNNDNRRSSDMLVRLNIKVPGEPARFLPFDMIPDDILRRAAIPPFMQHANKWITTAMIASTPQETNFFEAAMIALRDLAQPYVPTMATVYDKEGFYFAEHPDTGVLSIYYHFVNGLTLPVWLPSSTCDKCDKCDKSITIGYPHKYKCGVNECKKEFHLHCYSTSVCSDHAGTRPRGKPSRYFPADYVMERLVKTASIPSCPVPPSPLPVQVQALDAPQVPDGSLCANCKESLSVTSPVLKRSRVGIVSTSFFN